MRFRCWLTATAAAGMLACGLASAQVSVQISATIAPPPLPVYEQPPLPASGYLWIPGYWAWSDGGYYWVPGTWVLPPRAGLLWTPGYWEWANGAYFWHPGYWAPEVGFYGGVDYGFGYNGVGFVGGYWSGSAFFYNRAVNRFAPGVRVLHVYDRAVTPHRASRISFNGGAAGLRLRPTAAQLAIARGPHVAALAAQREHEQLAGRNRLLRDAYNHGRPAIAATQQPGRFSGRGVVAARGETTRATRSARPAAPAAGPQQRRVPPASPARPSAQRGPSRENLRRIPERPATRRPAPAQQHARPARPQERAPQARPPQARPPRARPPQTRQPQEHQPPARQQREHEPERRQPTSGT